VGEDPAVGGAALRQPVGAVLAQPDAVAEPGPGDDPVGRGGGGGGDGGRDDRGRGAAADGQAHGETEHDGRAQGAELWQTARRGRLRCAAMPRVVPIAALVAVLLLTLPAAASARGCSVRGKERKLGATYVTAVSATGISCSGALDVVRGYHRCRRARGGADGRCPRFSGYRCRERRTSSPTQYDSRATCRKGGRRVVQRYTQNT
jgi:hypothetical protein